MNQTCKGIIAVALSAVIALSCSDRPTNDQTDSPLTLDIAAIEKVLQMKGVEKDGEYKITVAQNDLNVVVDSFRIIPPMGLGSWAAFTPAAEGAMVMGDIVVTGSDLKPVQEEVIRQGLTITAIHNHFLRDKPHVMYMHIGGAGSEEKLAAGVKAIFERVAQVRGHNPAEGNTDAVENSLDVRALDNILGGKGETSRGVVKYTFPRPDIDLKDHDASVSAFAGFNTWAAWQGSPEHAAVAGDFCMLEDEVAPVIKTLIESGIEVVAVHNHMVHEQPRIFFLHYWGVGPADQLARALKAAIDKTGRGASRTTAAIIGSPAEVLCSETAF